MKTRPDIAIDISRLVARYQAGRLPTGVDRVSLAYLQHFQHDAVAKLSWRMFSCLVSQHISRQIFELILAWQLHGDAQRKLKRLLWVGILGCWAQTHWQGLRLFSTDHRGIDTWHFRRDMRWHNFRPLFVLHDLIPISHPQYCRPAEEQKHQLRIRNMLACGEGIIVNSQFTALALQSYAATQGLRLPPIVVAHLASTSLSKPTLPIAPPIAPQQESSSVEPYFVMIGTIEPRKNISLLMQVWRRLIRDFGTQAPQLRVIGQAGWEHTEVLQTLANTDLWKGRIVWYQHTSDNELVTHLQGARALLFPSFIEGYGMPVVESLQLGVPVIASDLPVLHEIARGIPVLLSAHDKNAWRDTILQYSLPNSDLRNAQLHRLKNFQPVQWADHFVIVNQFLKSLNRSAT